MASSDRTASWTVLRELKVLASKSGQWAGELSLILHCSAVPQPRRALSENQN